MNKSSEVLRLREVSFIAESPSWQDLKKHIPREVRLLANSLLLLFS